MLTERLVAAASLRCVEVEREEKRSVFRGVDYSTKYAFSLNCSKS